MIRFFSLLGLTIMLLHSAAFAQEDADAVLEEQNIVTEKDSAQELEDTEKEFAQQIKDGIKSEIKDLGLVDKADYETRLELSRKMHEIWPIRPKIEVALDAISEQVPALDRLKFKAAMREAIKFQALEEASIDSMADIFTVKELQAMIDFYGSKEGRSVSYKTADYEQALEPVMVKMIDKALLDVKLGKE